MTTMIRHYRDLTRLKTFEERYEYLRLSNIVGQATFGFDRYLNQMLYTSSKWKRTRDNIIIRDNACDLGVEGYEIGDNLLYGITSKDKPKVRVSIIIHHMNPITVDDVEEDRDILYDPEFLISTTLNTHNAIHFGDKSLLYKLPIDRKRNDTCPWK